MSLQILNDENVTGDKATENCDFLFSPPELTGRSSVLRLSQKENVPPRSVARAMKVTFQTPLRDPHTQRILSPSVTSKLEAPFALDETVGRASLPPSWTESEQQQLPEAVDAGTNGGTQQQAGADAAPPAHATNPESSRVQDPGSVLLGEGASAGSCIPEGPQSLPVPPGPVRGSPETASGEGVGSYSVDKSVTSAPESLEDWAGATGLEGAEKPPRAAEGSPDGQVSSAMAASPLGGRRGETLPMDLPREAPACPMDAPPREEQRPPAGTAGDTKAPSTPVPTGPAQPPPAGPPSPGPSAQKGEDTGHAAATQSEPVRLEIGFSDHPADGKAPPPRRLGKRPGTKPPVQRPEARQKAPRKTGEEGAHRGSAARGSYSLDWDKLDDPNFSPFGGGSKCAGGEARPPPTAEQPGAGAAAAGDAAQTRQVVRASAEDAPVLQGAAQTPQAATEEGAVSRLGSEPTALPTQQGPALDMAAETFRDPTEVLGTGAEVDYLEQFGASSFQESALRKQSLYLKFDPLLNDSPRRAVVPTAVVAAAAATETDGAPGADTPPAVGPAPAVLVDVDFLGALDVSVPGPFPCGLGPGLPPLPAGPIVDVLQYSQKELDTAVRAVQVENQELKSRCEELQEKNRALGRIMDEFEGVAQQAMEDSQKQKELATAEVQKVTEERDQLAADLSSLEKSFSDLFKRFEKQKEAIEGYRKNEELLKKCVEGYVQRTEQDGQRYQALKAHAEEKLRLANEEVAQVRSKAQAEALALQASLRKEQMRVQSLERAVEQKTKENEELTRICDDLISKMEKI
ncbi:transforming acidic coiled-coil-containing protein 3 [Dasypus novemcinctus]|uniref:transforming acidic coiled-coil-containing protein 3 n=1 Tax=Dasypus novemcinctus TaxID=9361 RepID=UPI00265E7C17|nr:transforming acidic coiled-coil-containing protein 3 [Dasypus novemcinctus]XP_058157634.1 transforming acidic coiled-coil-containing protein 3 [Dasypus novemcinctus]